MGKAPRLKFVHPGGAGLDNFKLHVRLIPVNVGFMDYVSGSEVG
jgi:hypothetical protein